MIRTTLFLALSAFTSSAAEHLLYCGSYTGKGQGEGITLLKFDSDTGRLSSAGTAAVSPSPSFLAFNPAGTVLYSVNEPVNGVSAFQVDRKSGALKLLGTCEVSDKKGAGPCHLMTDREGKYLITANYGGGSVSVVSLKPDGNVDKAVQVIQHEGSDPNAARQKEPHAHGVTMPPGYEKLVYVNDLGTDRVHVYQYDGAGKLTPLQQAESPAGSGPRHGAWHPEKPLYFSINELTCTVTTFRMARDTGLLTAQGTVSTLPGDLAPGYSTAEIIVHPGGKFVYGSNRGHDSIAVFRLGEKDELIPVQNHPAGVKTPRNFTLDPTGKWLLAAGQSSNSITVHRIDPETGKLTAIPGQADVGAPVCLLFLPAAKP